MPLFLEVVLCPEEEWPPADTGREEDWQLDGTLAPDGPEGEDLDLASDADKLRGLSLLLLFPPEMGTRGGSSLGGKLLKPGLESRAASRVSRESRPDEESLELECRSPWWEPWELGRFSESDLLLLSEDDLLLSLVSLFFSKGGMMDLEGADVSLPMAEHVWARRARGDFLASS